MYHILIVDDEFLVRLGLKTTINWEEHGYKVVGEAANGKEALEMVQTLKPDIVLVDIKMPLINGLEFIEEVQRTKKDISFIILSNYESFQYAKRAMNLGVSNYLLKSEINANTLLTTLNAVKNERTSREGGSSSRKQVRKTYLDNVLRQARINTYIPEKAEAPPAGLFVEENYVVIKYYCNIALMNEQSIDMLCKMMTSLVEDEFVGVIYNEVIFQSHYYFTMVCPSNEETKLQYKEKSASIGRKLNYYFTVDLKGGISPMRDANGIPQMLREAEWAREQSFFCSHAFIISEDKHQELIGSETKQHISNSTITKYLKEQDAEALKQYIHSMFEKIKEQGSYLCAHYAFIDFLTIAKSNLEKLKLEETANITNKLEYDNWNVLSSIEETRHYICDVFDNLLHSNSKSSLSYSASVKKTIAYIEENYAKNITLEDMAKNVEISNSYLSMLFKQETGINLVTYLNQYRIEKGKMLLATTNHKIYEIAEMVGFGSPYYFSKIFKDITGMQCKGYRDAFSRTEQ